MNSLICYYVLLFIYRFFLCVCLDCDRLLSIIMSEVAHVGQKRWVALWQSISTLYSRDQGIGICTSWKKKSILISPRTPFFSRIEKTGQVRLGAGSGHRDWLKISSGLEYFLCMWKLDIILVLMKMDRFSHSCGLHEIENEMHFVSFCPLHHNENVFV